MNSWLVSLAHPRTIALAGVCVIGVTSGCGTADVPIGDQESLTSDSGLSGSAGATQPGGSGGSSQPGGSGGSSQLGGSGGSSEAGGSGGIAQTGGSGGSGTCIDTVLCIQNTHWDVKLCRCVPDPSDASVPDAADAGFCIDTVDCIANTHWDTQQCRCVPDTGKCPSCATNQVCVENQTVGGALRLPDDAGQCPVGYLIVPEAPTSCSPQPTFHCADLPSACNTGQGNLAIAHCTCAPQLCPAAQCTDLSPTLMRCLQRVP
jgi:hypothetical protein